MTSAKRAATTPDLPTIAESGYPGYDAVPWWGIMVPAGTPRPLVNRINKDVLQALQSKEVRERFEVQGIEASGSSPEEFGKFLVAEIARWAKVVKQAGVKPE